MRSVHARMPVRRCITAEGYVFIAIALALTFLAVFFGFLKISAVLLLISVFCMFFFRNPERQVPDGEGIVVSPADGRVLYVKESNAPHAEGRFQKISIFMSVMNVHVNRFPITGYVKNVFYHPGKFLVASMDKASEKNERNVLLLEDESGHEIVLVQIAGIIARRIVCYVKSGDKLPIADRFGMIRFGSRLDLYLPLDTKILVKKGDKVKAGSTIVGRFE